MEENIKMPKESPLVNVERTTEEVKKLSFEALELSIMLEEFFLGTNQTPASEEERTSPAGWFQRHSNFLLDIRETLSITVRHLKTLASVLK